MTRQITTEWEHLAIGEIKSGQFLKRVGSKLVGADLAGVQGPQGEVGPQGQQGIQGVKGDTGDTGPQGQAGAAGAQGIQGVKGDTGAQGIQGNAGAQGQQGIQGVQGNPGPNLTTSAFGYTTGAGGVVTQQTNKTTGVTLNKLSGQITMNGAALAAAAEVTFTVTNNQVAATDVPVVAHASAGTAGAYAMLVTAVAAGSFKITVSNLSGGSLSEAPVINFVIIKGASS